MTGTERYERQTALPEIGCEGQKKLGNARVLVVGAGGLGSPLCLYLAASGIGTIGIADFDTVSISNLQRQILYNEADLGKAKADLAASRIKAINSATEVHVHGKITAGNAEAIISGYDIVADGCDNITTRLLINDTCLALGKTYVYAAVRGFEAQVSVFGHGDEKHSYRDIFLFAQADINDTENETEKSIVAPTAGLAASVQCSEILKIICRYGEVLAGKLWVCDMREMRTNIIEF